jgi:lipoprotein-anchoring transpeptidase ErfK/SrfK
MKQYSRRDFLKLAALGLGTMAFRPFFGMGESISQDIDNVTLGRIARDSISVYSQPDDKSRILYTRYQDELINIYDEVVADKGPAWNPLWYRVWRGYMHSAMVQIVQNRLNPVASAIAGEKQLAEVTVPFTQSMRRINGQGWQPVYRLYFESVHWVVAVEEGPDGAPWYRIKDELLDHDSVDYHVPAAHMRILSDDELTPITPDVPHEKKIIVVSLAQQTLVAYEGDLPVLETKISSGSNYKPNPDLPSWNTPSGKFNVSVKMASKHMGDGQLTSDLSAYELPGVPWCSFFAEHGVAFHGTYWHNNFGNPMSHGCVNMKTAEAKWLFRWVRPIHNEIDWDHKGYGTTVIVT